VELIEKRWGVCAGSGLGDQLLGFAVFCNECPDRFGQEPIEQFLERDAAFAGNFGEELARFENLGENGIRDETRVALGGHGKVSGGGVMKMAR
jgi:hypothetical protein